MSSFPHLSALALALGALALPLRAQDAPSSAQAAPTPSETEQNSPDALATAARNILELVEVHNFRMQRIDAMLQQFRALPDQDKVRQFSLLREREMGQYQQALETYRRLLGEADFARVAGLLRNHFEKDQRTPRAMRDAPQPERVAKDDASAADRADRVRRMMAAQAAEARQRAAEAAAYERGQVIARMRASQRAQLAQRLAQARADQLAARAAASQRYMPMPEPPSNRRADPAQGGLGLGGRGANNRGNNPIFGAQTYRR